MSIKTDIIIIGGLVAGLVLFKDQISGAFGKAGNTIGSSVGSFTGEIVKGITDPFKFESEQDDFFTNPRNDPIREPSDPSVFNDETVDSDDKTISPFGIEGDATQTVELAKKVVGQFNPNSRDELISKAIGTFNPTNQLETAGSIIAQAGRSVNPDLGTAGIFDLPQTEDQEFLPLSQAAVDYYASLGINVNRVFPE